MITRLEVDEALKPFEDVSEYIFNHSDRLSVAMLDDQFEFRSNGDSWPMTPDSVYETVRWVPGMGLAALREWPVDMALSVVNWWLQNGIGGYVRLLVKDGEVVAIPGPGTYLKPSRMIEGFLSGNPGEVAFESIFVRGGQVDLTAVSRDIETVVGESDRLFGGINLRFRPDGTRDVEFLPYLWREICSNGLGTRHGLAVKKLNKFEEANDVYDFLMESSSSVWTCVSEALATVKDLRDVEVADENLGAVVRDLMEQGNIPPKLREIILESIAIENDGTMYGVSQGFARAALSLEVTPSQVFRLRMAAGAPLSVSQHCEMCSRPVGTQHREAVSVSP